MAGIKHANHTFGPEYQEDSRILILGSFPSVKSREADFYYGHPQNRFWKILWQIFGSPSEMKKGPEVITTAPSPENISEKKAFLKANHIALWDVIEECDIDGSSDSSIRNVIPVDIQRILETSTIERIFVNGKTAEKYYLKYLEPICGRSAVCLPSSSPANAAWRFEALVDEWRRLLTPSLSMFDPNSKLQPAGGAFYADKDIADGYLLLPEEYKLTSIENPSEKAACHAESSDPHSVKLPQIRFHSLDQIPGIQAFFTTRLGGTSKGQCGSLNFGFSRQDQQENILHAYTIAAEDLSTDLDHIVMTDQVHTTEIRQADTGIALGKECRPKLSGIDGLWTDKKGIALSATFADCVPVYLADPLGKRISLVHSGWKGTVGKISGKAVSILREHGTNPTDLVCVIGPSIPAKEYEVSSDVIEQFKEAFRPDEWEDIYIQTNKNHYQLDLWAAIYHTLIDAGVDAKNIHFSGVSTYENADILFSHRRSHGIRGNENAFLMMDECM